ncbi:hypothetical protein C6495_17320 [Candidatus Poribacteria bacterium]|nr:MAG: hypothetical protein C6495_17320 [Candidatus Poribacteria bacterium]
MRGEGQALALRAPSGRRGFKPRPMVTLWYARFETAHTGGRDAGGLSYRRDNLNCAERSPNPANPLILEILLQISLS